MSPRFDQSALLLHPSFVYGAAVMLLIVGGFREGLGVGWSAVGFWAVGIVTLACYRAKANRAIVPVIASWVEQLSVDDRAAFVTAYVLVDGLTRRSLFWAPESRWAAPLVTTARTLHWILVQAGESPPSS
jgi:hypothetical protein